MLSVKWYIANDSFLNETYFYLIYRYKNMQNQSVDLTKQTIIVAATEQFIDGGFHNLNSEQVAGIAQVPITTVNTYFETKEVLLTACISHFCADLLQLMEVISLDAESVEISLEKIAEVFVDLAFNEKGIALYRLAIAECSGIPELAEQAYASGPKVGLQLLQNYLETVNQLGIFNIKDTKFAADVFFSLLKGERHFQCLLGVQAVPSAEEKQQMVAEVVKFYVQGFLYAVQ